MQRFFVDCSLMNIKKLVLSEEIGHQCKHVLRYQNDQSIILNDYFNHQAQAHLKFEDTQTIAIIDYVEEIIEEDIQITLIQALIKKDKWEFVLQKATELGVYQIIPLVVSRNVVKWNEKDIDSKLKRDQKIIQEAAEQSQRMSVPCLHKPIGIQECGTFLSQGNFVAYENEKGTQLKDCLGHKQSYSIVIGPEGGFTEAEIASLNLIGFKSVGLGKRILRAETAAIVSITIIETVCGS